MFIEQMETARMQLRRRRRLVGDGQNPAHPARTMRTTSTTATWPSSTSQIAAGAPLRYTAAFAGFSGAPAKTKSDRFQGKTDKKNRVKKRFTESKKKCLIPEKTVVQRK
jgi:hypothetical protein